MSKSDARGRPSIPIFAMALATMGAPALAGCQDPEAETAAADPTDDPRKTPSDFVRFVVEGKGGHLDTAITTYRKGSVELILFGAVHIADQAHYELLQNRFETRDALLYEMVAPEGHRPKKNEPRGGVLSMVQNGLKSGLELQFQLDGVDYSPANFVHADMTPTEFSESMEERGESILSLMFSMMQNAPEMQEAMAELNLPDDLETDLVKAFRSGTGRHSLRMVFASQLEQMELLSAGGEGSTLLEGRNEKCLEVLAREIEAGKTKIGIYYGAAHFPHMEKRIVDDLGFEKVGHEWIKAWDCAPRPDPVFDRELYVQRRTCKRGLRKLARAVASWREARGGDAVPSLEDLTGGAQPAFAGDAVDPWGNPWRIRADDREITLLSVGQDGEPGTDDDLEETVDR